MGNLEGNDHVIYILQIYKMNTKYPIKFEYCSIFCLIYKCNYYLSIIDIMLPLHNPDKEQYGKL